MCHLVLIGLPLAALSVFWFLPLPIALPAFLAIGAAPEHALRSMR